MKYLDKEENGFVQFHIPHELLNDFKTSNNTKQLFGDKMQTCWKVCIIAWCRYYRTSWDNLNMQVQPVNPVRRDKKQI